MTTLTTMILLSLLLTAASQSFRQRINLQYEKGQVFREILQDIITKTNVSSTALIMTDSLPHSFLINTIIKLFMNTALMNCITSGLSETRHLRPRCPTSSSTLLLYIYRSKDLSDFLSIQDIGYIFLYGSRHPKLLFVSLLEDDDADYQDLLRFMWTKKILDVAILEMPMNPISFIVHQYNPFTDSYTRQFYSSSIDWFPKKLIDLHGYPIKIDVNLRPGYNWVFRNSQGYVEKYHGYDARALSTIKEAMNFTEVIIPGDDELSLNKNETMGGLLRSVISGRVDVLLTTLPLTLQAKELAETTETFGSERWCVLMPMIYKPSTFEYGRVLRIVMSLIVIVVFWLICTVLRFQSPCWKFFNILGMILGSTLYGFKIVPTSERILFVCLVLVAAVCSSTLYADITTTTIGTPVEIHVEKYQDLIRYGLTPIYRQGITNIDFQNADQDFMTLKDKLIIFEKYFDCGSYLFKNVNVSCLMESRMARVVIATKKRVSTNRIIINDKLCYWTPPNGYYFSKYSPYLARISDILLRSQQGGLAERWFMDYFDHLKSGTGVFRNDERKDYENQGMKFQIFAIITCGYVFSILVFLGELIVHRLKTPT